jgi:predicted Na+-dependent transporter
MQADKYPTLSKAIFYYFKMLEKLAIIKTKSINIAIKNAANAAYLALNNYYSKTKDLLALYIIIIYNSRYKIKAFK